MATFWLRSSIPSGPSRPRPRRDIENASTQLISPVTMASQLPDEKTPLLRKPTVSSTDDDVPSSSPTTTHRLRLRKLLLILLCISVFTPLYSLTRTLSSILPRPGPLNPPRNPLPPPIDKKFYSKEYVFPLNSNQRFYAHTLSVSEYILPSHFPGGINGTLRILTGEEFQSHEFLVYLQVYSATSTQLSRIVSHTVDIPPMRSGISITSSSPDQVSKKEGGGEEMTSVDIYIYTRPRTFLTGGLSLSTYISSISFPLWTTLSVSRLSLYSVFGNIDSQIPTDAHDYLTHHSLETTAVHGNITGSWSLGSIFSAAAPGGYVNISLAPKRWSYGPWTESSLKISAEKDVSLHMPFSKSLLSLRNSTASIYSSSGNLDISLVTGPFTNLTSPNGSIKAVLLPYWGYLNSTYSPHISPKLLSTSKSDTSVVVKRAEKITKGYIDLLEITTASHTSTDGKVDVKYPIGDWRGMVGVESEKGRADIEGVGQVIRDGKGKVRWEGERESRVNVKGKGDARFEFWKDTP